MRESDAYIESKLRILKMSDEEKEQASKMFAGYNPYPLPEMIGGITFSEDKGDE